MRKLFRNTIFIANILFALALGLTYLVPYANPQKLWFFPLIGLFQLYLFFINLVFVVFWLFFRKKYFLISTVIVVLGIGNIGNFIRYSPRSTHHKEGIKVLTYNVHHYNSYFVKRKKDTAILDFIAGQNADIICLQENRLQKKGELNPVKLKSRFPGIKHCQLAHMSAWGGPVTFSRFPILNMGEIRFKESSNMVIFCDIKVEKDTMRVYNCHLQSFSIYKEEYSLLDSLSFESEKILEAKTVGGKLRRGNSKRSFQVKILSDHIKSCPYEKIIVCGDFNDIPNSFTYSKISNLLNDSFKGSGTGTSNTFRYPIAPFRIDYVFHSDHFKSYNYIRHKVNYSDHYPVSVLLVPKK